MKITTRSIRNEEIQEVKLVADVESEILPWGHKDRYRWQPVSMATTFRRNRINGGEWSAWRYGQVNLSGHNVLKSGGAGEPRTAQLYSWNIEDFPAIQEWLAFHLEMTDPPEPYFGPAEIQQ